MTAQPVSQLSMSIRRTIARYRRRIALALLMLVAALALYSVTGFPAVSAPATGRARAAGEEPAAQSVIEYLRAHGVLAPLPTPAVRLDPEQQSVMRYVRAHESVEQSPAPWDAAVQAVRDYLRAHSR